MPISEAELQEWMELESIDGVIGQRRGDLNAGIIAQALYAVNGKGKSLYECANVWDAEEWEDYQRLKLRETFTGRK